MTFSVSGTRRSRIQAKPSLARKPRQTPKPDRAASKSVSVTNFTGR